jgi:hypothetical protein
MPQLEQVSNEQDIVYKPQRKDAAGRTAAVAASMDLPPASGSRPLVPGGKERVAIGGNKVMPPILSLVDEAYAEAVAETYEQYPKAFYHRALKFPKGPDGKPIPGAEPIPLKTADEVNPNYPVPFKIATELGVKGVLTGDSQAVKEQHYYKTRLVPHGWQVGDKIDMAACKREEAELLKAGWVDNPSKLNLPAGRTLEEESE